MTQPARDRDVPDKVFVFGLHRINGMKKAEHQPGLSICVALKG